MEKEYLKSKLEKLFCERIIADSTSRVKKLIEVTEKKILELDKTGSIEFLQMESSEFKVTFGSVFSSPIDYTLGLNDCLQRYAKKIIRGNELSLGRLNPFLRAISDLEKIVHSALLILDSSEGNYSQAFDLNLTLDTQLRDRLYLELGTYYLSELEKLEQVFDDFNEIITIKLSKALNDSNHKEIKIKHILTDLHLITKELEEVKVLLLDEEVKFIYRNTFTKPNIDSVVNSLTIFKYSNWLENERDNIQGISLKDIIIDQSRFIYVCNDFCRYKMLPSNKQFHIISKLKNGYKWNGTGVKSGIPFLAAFLSRLEEQKIIKTYSEKKFAELILDYFLIPHEDREYKFLLESMSNISEKYKSYFALEIKD